MAKVRHNNRGDLMNKKIIIGVIIVPIVIIGLIAILGSNSTEKSTTEGMEIFKADTFQFEASNDFEWDVSIEGSNGWLTKDIYSFDIEVEEEMRSYDIYEGNIETVDGINYKIDTTGFDGTDDGLNQGSMNVYFEKNGTIFSISITVDEDKADKEFMINTIETIIKTMTPI